MYWEVANVQYALIKSSPMIETSCREVADYTHPLVPINSYETVCKHYTVANMIYENLMSSKQGTFFLNLQVHVVESRAIEG